MLFWNMYNHKNKRLVESTNVLISVVYYSKGIFPSVFFNPFLGVKMTH